MQSARALSTTIQLLTRRSPPVSFEIEPMFHAARDVPAHEITSVVDIEEARVGRAWEAICVKSPISESHPAPTD